MSITWVPVHGNGSMAPGLPSLLTVIVLIHLRPNSPAKNLPS
jgi:hypothetical protein